MAIALSGALLIAGTADAAAKKPAPKPVCHLITSPSGDAAVLGVGDPNVDTMDIVSADIAADKRNITAVIRVKKLAPTAPTGSPTGIRWQFGFKAEDTTFTMAAHTDPTGAIHYDAAYSAPGINSLYSGGVSGTFDLAKSEIHITAPTSLMAAQATIKPGKELSALAASTSMEVAIPEKSGKLGGGSVLQSAPIAFNTAKASDSYVVGTLSCVKPGK